MRYTVSYKVEGRLEIKVDADSIEEAQRKAYESALDADLNRMDYIDMEDILVEDEHDIVWER